MTTLNSDPDHRQREGVAEADRQRLQAQQELPSPGSDSELQVDQRRDDDEQRPVSAGDDHGGRIEPFDVDEQEPQGGGDDDLKAGAPEAEHRSPDPNRSLVMSPSVVMTVRPTRIMLTLFFRL